MREDRLSPSLFASFSLFIALLASALPAGAQPQPFGLAFRINTTTMMDQSTPEIATDFDGDFVVVWESDGQDGSGSGIYAQFFSEDGEEEGLEFAVNNTTVGNQINPAVGMSDDELFAIAWVGPDNDGSGIYLRIFDAQDATTPNDIQVNSTVQGIQRMPGVAIAEDGQVMVVWQGPDGNGEGVFGRIFDPDGTPVTSELTIPAAAMGNQTLPVVDDVDEDGTFVVAWEGPDGDGRGIFARGFDDLGMPLSGDVVVNTQTAGDQVGPSVGVRTSDFDQEDNGFVIAWTGPDSNGTGIYGRFFSETGIPDGPETRINTSPIGDQSDPDVSIDDDGNFVVTWSVPDPNPILGTPEAAFGSPILIRGRRSESGGSNRQALFAPQDAAGGGASDVFTIARGLFSKPAIAVEADGDFVAAWQIQDDGNGSGIFGRRYGLRVLFIDGFETGDTLEWGSTFP